MGIMERVDSDMGGLISDLQTLIRQPSISATNKGIPKCAELVRNVMECAGIHSKILHLGDGVAPLVFGHVQSKCNPGRTLLFYNHYDVQPAEPFDLWDDPPFDGVRRGNKIFGRGQQTTRENWLPESRQLRYSCARQVIFRTT